MSAIQASAALTPEQRQIVEYGDGPLVVIAGAGTGKTRVIVERVRWLLETKGEGTLDAHGRLLAAEPTPTAGTAAEQAEPPAALGLWDARPPTLPTATTPSTGRSCPSRSSS